MGLAAYVAFCRDVEMKNIWRAAELVDAEELRLLTGRFYEDVERDVAAAAVALWRAEMEARPPLSPTARALNYPTENTTPDAGTSRAEDASAMKR